MRIECLFIYVYAHSFLMFITKPKNYTIYPATLNKAIPKWKQRIYVMPRAFTFTTAQRNCFPYIHHKRTYH